MPLFFLLRPEEGAGEWTARLGRSVRRCWPHSGVVGSLWGFAANVTGTVDVLGATGAAGVWMPLLSEVLLVSWMPVMSRVLLLQWVLLLPWVS